VNPIHEAIFAGLVKRVRAILGSHVGQTVGILGGPGHGDHCRALCLAAAVRRNAATDRIVCLFRFNGSMVEWDLAYAAKAAGVADDVLMTPALPYRTHLRSELRSKFETFYDSMPFAVGVYPHWGNDREMRQNTLCAATVGDLYSGFPMSNWKLNDRDEPFSWWELARMTTELDVRPEDLPVPLECAPLPDDAEMRYFSPHPDSASRLEAGVTNWERADVHMPRYVVIHNGAGGRTQTKCAPIELFNGIVSRLAADGVRCVQVGTANEPLVKNAIDRRGLRLPLTARLMKESLGLVAVEGFLQYIAAGLRIPAAIFFGPTPYSLFAMPSNLNMLTGKCPQGRCFWLHNRWGERCVAQGPEGGPCLNLPSADSAAEPVAKYIAECEEAGKLKMGAVKEGVA